MVGLARLVGEDDAVGCLARGDDDLLDAELRRRLDDVVGAHHVDAEELVVGHDHDARDGGEMDDRIDRLGRKHRVELVHAPCA